MNKSRRRFSTRVGVVVILSGGLAASDLFPQVKDFWVRQPATFQLVSDAVFLAATYLVVDELIRRREARSWSDFARVCFRTLAQEAEDVRHRLKFYVDATSPRATIGATGDEFTAPNLVRIIESITNESMNQDERLDRLLDHNEWRALTYVGIRWTKRENWTLVQRVAPILLSSEESRPLLAMFSSLHDELVALERLFEEAAQKSWSCCGEQWKQKVLYQWRHVIEATHTSEHELHSGLTGLKWYSTSENKVWWFQDHQRA